MIKRSLVLLLLFTISAAAQNDDCPTCPPNGTDNTEYEVIKLEDQIGYGEFVEGEVLVKFKDEITTVLGKSGSGLAVTGIASVDALFQTYLVAEANKLFPNAIRRENKETFTTFNGYTFARPSLHNIHKLNISEENLRSVFELIDELNDLPEVVYAEPNYIYSIVEDEPVSPELTEEELIEWLDKNPEYKPINAENSSSPDGVSGIKNITPNDPLYPQQWGIPATQIDAVWDSTTGDADQIIAILDTGVDWLHPDLQNKIWQNPGEIAGNGIDDDGNGFVDDIRGWDYINSDNNPTDDNSHGTHVAGITAAETDNGIGIAGVNWMAKIMPIKVFQSSGRGDAATITEGIVYASEKGADVINMSFSSVSRSFTMEDALANAYANSVLVAAAGNDSKAIGKPEGRFWPAAISYVLGIEATTQIGENAKFSNFDQDGPVYSDYEDLNNYELKAPGVKIISSIPNGNYRVYNGTSMSTPIVAGAVSLYRTVFPGQSQEIMWGNFINTINNHIQLFDALNAEADPVLWFVSNTIVDTLDGDDDGRVDAGETIEIWFEVRNTWGQSDSVWCGIEFGEFEDTSTASILQDKAFIGSISAYARRTNEMNTLKIQINRNVEHNRDIVFESSLWFEGAMDTIKKEILLTVEKGEELSGIFSDSLTLTPDKFWLISGSFKISPDGVLIIKPGTEIEIKSKLINDGLIYAHGTPDSLIKISGTQIIGGSVDGNLDISYAEIDLSCDSYNILAQNGSISHSIITLDGFVGFASTEFVPISDCILKNWNVLRAFSSRDLLSKCNIENIRSSLLVSGGVEKFEFCNINKFGRLNNSVQSGSNLGIAEFTNANNLLGSFGKEIYYAKEGYYENIPNQYWGTSDSVNIENRIFDFQEDAELSRIIFTPYLEQPTDSAHGCVWKVLVNGIDPQDEVLDPIGPGEHRFDVYFNRPMDIDYTPSLSFGVRDPYTQQAVTDSSFWSADSMIWTAYKTIQLHTGDGINRVRVADARDTEDFEIPIEDQRFEFVIDAAGLSSTDFNAIAGLGKIELDWKIPEDVSDLLGYNLYRFTNLTDTTYTDTLIINSEMILDTSYVDYDVVPGNNYYYQYTVVKTDFSESDRSKVVGSTALTASAGDANGDLTVTVLDLVSIVSYLLNENPQPFIFEAADVDANGVINVLDIVSTVNLIMGQAIAKTSNGKSSNAELIVENGNLFLNGAERLSALQLRIVGSNIENSELIAGELLNGMEFVHRFNKDTLDVVIFNYKNKALNSREGKLFGLPQGQILSIQKIVASDADGNLINLTSNSTEVLLPKEYLLYQNYPNPFNPETRIKYGLPEPQNVTITIFNILGQRIKTYNLAEQPAGYHEVMWKSTNDFNRKVATGVYIYRIKAGDFVDVKKMLLLK